jgi:hypothetical protein
MAYQARVFKEAVFNATACRQTDRFEGVTVTALEDNSTMRVWNDTGRRRKTELVKRARQQGS